MKFFPRFFLLYFLVFHIYFFSYPYGFTYVAFAATAVFMQHLILYFWNRFEVPALQRFIQTRRPLLQQQADIHITSSTILASTLHITRLNMRNPTSNSISSSGSETRPAHDQFQVPNAADEVPGPQETSETDNAGRVGNPLQHIPESASQQREVAHSPGSLNPFNSMLLRILGGASSGGLNSFWSLFRDVRDHGQENPESPQQENHAT
ncbi:Membralin-like protein [Thalictrum thalictroides]|uniref:Membralin-like protein n=1 Tax=Thalictrum thalictroides TaxID=46969 RepID=A0A7J6VTT3_THATH|nr:Membralin-like protein [Thalictrum thalictroides]